MVRRDLSLVIKIGGSTLGSHDTTLEDLVALQRQGILPLVVHGGGALISQWMERQGYRPRFVRGLRVTDAESIEIVTAVLAGLVNKHLVAGIYARGGSAIGLAGSDGALLEATLEDPQLGLVGRIQRVNLGPLQAVLARGYIPVVASVAVHQVDGSQHSGVLLNINADTAAGEIATCLGASHLVFLTDVEGVMDATHRVIRRLTSEQARALIASGTVAGGMIPKVSACLRAIGAGTATWIIDGRRAHALLDSLEGNAQGTQIG